MVTSSKPDWSERLSIILAFRTRRWNQSSRNSLWYYFQAARRLQKNKYVGLSKLCFIALRNSLAPFVWIFRYIDHPKSKRTYSSVPLSSCELMLLENPFSRPLIVQNTLWLMAMAKPEPHPFTNIVIISLTLDLQSSTLFPHSPEDFQQNWQTIPYK